MSLEDMANENGEMIAVLDGIDEISSQNYQSRWSYMFNEILPHREFLPCVKRDIGCFVVDFDRISHTVAVEENQIVDSVEVMDQLAASEDFKLMRAPKRYLSGSVMESPPRSKYRRLKTDTELLAGWRTPHRQESALLTTEKKSDFRNFPGREFQDSECAPMKL